MQVWCVTSAAKIDPFSGFLCFFMAYLTDGDFYLALQRVSVFARVHLHFKRIQKPGSLPAMTEHCHKTPEDEVREDDGDGGAKNTLCHRHGPHIAEPICSTAAFSYSPPNRFGDTRARMMHMSPPASHSPALSPNKPGFLFRFSFLIIIIKMSKVGNLLVFEISYKVF